MSDRVDGITQMNIVRLRQRVDQARAQAQEFIRGRPGKAADIWGLVCRPGPELRDEPGDDMLELVSMLAMLGLMEATLSVVEEQEPR